MTKSQLVTFCLTVAGTFGVLYSVHSARSANNLGYELDRRTDETESRINVLDEQVYDLKSTTDELENNQRSYP